MIKDTELRIGNLLQEKSTGDILPVLEIYRGEVINSYQQVWITYNFDRYGKYTQYIHNCEPIPLTEEWLLKFGFEKKQKEFYNRRAVPTEFYWLKEFYVDIDELTGPNGLEPFICFGYDKDYFPKDHTYFNWIATPDYVHQLQNLYFALTGHELEVKEYADTL